MLRHNLENHSNEQDEVELSRRGFFGRLTLGAVLAVTMPGIAHAAKSTVVKEDKQSRLAKSAKSAVRLPKHQLNKAVKSTHQTKKAAIKTAKSGKSATSKNASLHSAQLDHHARQNTRVRDVYTGKKQGAKAEINHVGLKQNQGGKTHSIIRPGQREPFVGSQDFMSVADRGRLATHRSLVFQNPHTGEKLNLTYFEKGRYLTDALDEINYLLRDHRTGDVHPIDPELLDQLHDLKQMLGLSQPFGVICGYRSPLTNAKLHAESTGVANNSFHMYGRAVDIRIERFDLRRIHNAAIAMHRGGVGYYPDSNFIHLDTGTFRTWSL